MRSLKVERTRKDDFHGLVLICDPPFSETRKAWTKGANESKTGDIQRILIAAAYYGAPGLVTT